MSVIAVFYIIVFYAGAGAQCFIIASAQPSIAGFFYLLSKKVNFKRKDFVPYSVRMERERQERLKMLKETAPPVTDTSEENDENKT